MHADGAAAGPAVINVHMTRRRRSVADVRRRATPGTTKRPLKLELRSRKAVHHGQHHVIAWSHAMAKTRFASPPAFLLAGLPALAGLLACLLLVLAAGDARADARTSSSSTVCKADDFRVRTSAALQLGATGDDAAVGPLCGALGDNNDVVRQAAGAGLARLGKSQAVGCVQQHLQSEQNASVKAQLEKTLSTLQPAGGGGGGGGGGGTTPARPTSPAPTSTSRSPPWRTPPTARKPRSTG